MLRDHDVSVVRAVGWYVSAGVDGCRYGKRCVWRLESGLSRNVRDRRIPNLHRPVVDRRGRCDGRNNAQWLLCGKS
jgi:hypothetical protein